MTRPSQYLRRHTRRFRERITAIPIRHDYLNKEGRTGAAALIRSSLSMMHAKINMHDHAQLVELI